MRGRQSGSGSEMGPFPSTRDRTSADGGGSLDVSSDLHTTRFRLELWSGEGGPLEGPN